jgi:magnesium chelatase family protein
VIIIGRPGAGKTLRARAMLGILTQMSIDDALDMTRIYSVADSLPREISIEKRMVCRP